MIFHKLKFPSGAEQGWVRFKDAKLKRVAKLDIYNAQIFKHKL